MFTLQEEPGKCVNRLRAQFLTFPENRRTGKTRRSLPKKLGEYLRALKKLSEAHKYRCVMYGHFGDGCVHNRINFDLQSEEGIKKFRSFMEEAQT